METNQDGSEVLETTEEQTVAEETTDEGTTEESKETETSQTDEEKAQLRKDLEEEKRKNAKLFERAKKAEAAKSSSKETDGLTAEEVYVLFEHKVAQQDIEEVRDYAKLKKLSIADALKTNFIKSLLANKTDERKTATATNTRGGQRGASKVSGEDLLSKAERTNELPDSEEGMAAIFQARMARKFPKRK